MVLSRPDHTIKIKLQRYQGIIRLEGENQTESIRDDISLVIQKHIKDLESQGIPPEVTKGFSASLELHADNTFLWVALIIDVLKKHLETGGGVSRGDIEDILRDRDIFSIYRRMLRKLDQRRDNDARKMLQIIIAAKTAFSIEQMVAALTVRPSHTTLQDIESDFKSPLEGYVKALCGNFVRVIDGEIHLVHQTAREFLLEQAQGDKVLEDGWQHSISMIECNRTLLRACTLYMICGKRCNWNASLYDRDLKIATKCLIRDQPLLKYAILNWRIHIDESNLTEDMTLFKQVVEFCEPSATNRENSRWLITPFDVDLLGHHGCDVNVSNRKLQTPLDIAVKYGNLEVANTLLKAGGMVHLSKDEEVSYYEHWRKIFQSFVEEWPHLITSYPERSWISEGQLDFIGLQGHILINNSIDTNSRVTSDVLKYLFRGNQETVDWIMTKKSDIDVKGAIETYNLDTYFQKEKLIAGDFSYSAILEAIRADPIPVINALIRLSGDDKKTEAHIIAQYGDASMMSMFHASNSVLRTIDGEGKRPLDYLLGRKTMHNTVIQQFVPEDEDSDIEINSESREYDESVDSLT
ncbi:hypothetical protein F5Y00DRAFT_267783 [Daldinia vernicosa]|uniref:uncharacterized protein n=1 Tax=Daldinia vernicosa TaxID=114800 RepID=UPI002008E1AA|nr:uncharacterized protein F5Y00DRAFT_267783 [Daldinia vernicosa]KAI0843812.1 hypothetical protein F5Y00DRAFT_267783 [Daldinia vernicosa]